MRELSTSQIGAFEHALRNAEKSAATIEKYLRDIRTFLSFKGKRKTDKSLVLEYKAWLAQKYAVTSANSMLASLNSFFRFCGRPELCVKQFRIQRQAFCSEEKELSKTEYIRLLQAAKRQGKERLNLVLQTICGSGIRVSELKYITAEAVIKGEARVSCKGKLRRIFIVPQLRKRLLSYIKKEGIRAGSIFLTRNGLPLCRSNIWREMKSLCRAAGVDEKKVFPHNLRHLFARIFYAAEKDIAKLADILGHSSINTTRIYIITTGAEHRRRMEHMHLIL